MGRIPQRDQQVPNRILVTQTRGLSQLRFLLDPYKLQRFSETTAFWTLRSTLAFYGVAGDFRSGTGFPTVSLARKGSLSFNESETLYAARNASFSELNDLRSSFGI